MSYPRCLTRHTYKRAGLSLDGCGGIEMDSNRTGEKDKKSGLETVLFPSTMEPAVWLSFRLNGDDGRPTTGDEGNASFVVRPPSS